MITEKDFNELVWNYGASGTKVLDNMDQKTKSAVVETWAEIESMLDDSSEEEIDKMINARYPDTKYRVNYEPVDSEGFCTGNGGTIGFDGNICNVSENEMLFDTIAEAQAWIQEHKAEFAEPCNFAIW